MPELRTAQPEQCSLLLQTLCQMAESYFYAGQMDDAIRLLQAGQLIAGMPDVRPRDAVGLLVVAGHIYTWHGSLVTGDYTVPIALLARAEQLLSSLDDDHLRARALNALGQLSYQQTMTAADADFSQALQYFQEALGLSETTQDPCTTCEALFHLGLVAERSRQHEEARTNFITVYQRAKQHGCTKEVAAAARHLGLTCLRYDNHDEALAYFQEGYVLLQAMGHHVFVPFAQLSIGEAFHLQGRWDQAQHYYELALSAAQRMQVERATVQIAYSLGELWEAQNDWIQAERYYTEAYHCALAINFKLGISMCESKLRGRAS